MFSRFINWSGVKDLQITREKSRDTGLALLLIILLFDLYSHNKAYINIAVVVLLISMLVPLIFKPLAYLWFGFATITGKIISSILLTIIYFIIVTPVGFVRRYIGIDRLKLKEWKKNNNSAFNERNHTFVPADLEKPY